MKHRTFLLVSLLCFFSNVVVAQYGKISGYVTDKETKEPLIGASVSIIGTTQGGVTDIQGRYVILNVPPGIYEIKASYIGYQGVVFSGINVTAGLTQTVDFQLQSSTVELPPVTVAAERPLIEKSATNVTRIVKAEDFAKYPVRGVAAYVALQPGIVELNGQYYIRGSRPDEVGYLLEGANTKRIRGAGNLVTTIPEAVEEVLIQAGGYSAEYGGSNAGIIQQNLKTGSARYSGFAQFETDDFGNYPNKKFLGAYSYGYQNTVLGVSGQVGSDRIKFFLAGENSFTRDYSPVFWSGYDFGHPPDDGLRSGLPGDTSVAPVKWESGNISERFANRYTGNGTVLFDYNPVLVRIAGSYTWSRTKINNRPIYNLFNEARLPNVDNTNLFLSAKGTYFLSPKSFIEVNLSHTNTFGETYDPNFGSDFLSYSDSAKAAQKGWKFVDATTPPYDYRFNGFYFARPGEILTGYSKAKTLSYSVSASWTSQINRHELKVGGAYEYWTFRNYAIGGLTGLLQSIRSRPGIQSNREEFLKFIRQTVAVDNYGYDELGGELDSGLDGPKHPYFASFYLQDKFEFDDLVVNAGVRLDHLSMDSWRMKDAANPLYDPVNLQIGELVSGSKFTFVEPRLGFAFPVTDRTVFHVQYGKFVQAPDLNRVYKGRRAAYQYFLFAFQDPLGYDLSPIRTTQYEAGFTQQFTDFASFDITGFYKDVKGLIQVSRQATVPGSPVTLYHILVNSDFATTTGLELSLRLRRTKRVQAQVNYTLSAAKGTNSFSNSAAATSNSGVEVPTLVTPLLYDERHRGSVSIDYRFAHGDGGPILQDLGLNLLFTFNSGHRFTQGTGGLGQQGPELGGILNDFDPRQRRPIEPINSSTTPWVFNLDLNIDKNLRIADHTLNVYARVLNVLNLKNVVNVYYRTGNAYDDGYLTNPELSELNVAGLGPQYVEMYRAINLDDRQHQWLLNGTDLFSSPRQIRLGVRFEY